MKPSIPKGTRDFLPAESSQRKYLFQILEEIFKLYGYSPIETPTMENLSTLTGKYGEEGDQLLFKVLNNGDFLAKADEKALQERDSASLVASISRRGLRYDLTVPFARFVVMHQNDIQFPFKRYQIQPVWRADRPQKGRYQEFYQCDVDIIGSNSLLNEAELVRIMDQVFFQLGIKVRIIMNHRKILLGLADILKAKDKFTELTVMLDKIEKIGFLQVKNQMLRQGFSEEQCKTLESFLQFESAEFIKQRMESSKDGLTGLEEIQTIRNLADKEELKNELIFDIKLARGLNYYTGAIFEVVATDNEFGSLVGGGRYDDLTGVFGLPGVSGVGVSFGAERIFDVMMANGLFPERLENITKVLILTMDEKSLAYGFKVVQELRKSAIPADIYPDPVKMGKQLKYADARNIPYAIIIGPEEIESGLLSIKDLKSGEQKTHPFAEIKSMLLA